MTSTNETDKETFESEYNKYFNHYYYLNNLSIQELLNKLKQLHDTEIKEKDKEIESIKKLYNLVRENDTKVEIELNKQIQELTNMNIQLENEYIKKVNELIITQNKFIDDSNKKILDAMNKWVEGKKELKDNDKR